MEKLSTDPLLGGCWWDKIDESLVLKYKKEFLINNEDSMYLDLLDILPNFLSFHNECIIDIPCSSVDDLSYSEKCYILLKYIKSKNRNKFLHTFLREKKRFGFGDYKNSELKKIILTFFYNNKKIFNLDNDGVHNKWLGFCSKVFLELIKVSLSKDNPIYLVKDKIYFYVKHEKNVKTNLVRILEKALRTFDLIIKSNYCLNDHKISSSLLSRLFNDKRSISKRYLKNLKYFERKK